MKNLKLAHKMLVLTLILMVSLLVVAYVAVDRLSVVNAEIQQLVDQTMKKGNCVQSESGRVMKPSRANRALLVRR